MTPDEIVKAITEDVKKRDGTLDLGKHGWTIATKTAQWSGAGGSLCQMACQAYETFIGELPEEYDCTRGAGVAEEVTVDG